MKGEEEAKRQMWFPSLFMGFGRSSSLVTGFVKVTYGQCRRLTTKTLVLRMTQRHETTFASTSRLVLLSLWNATRVAFPLIPGKHLQSSVPTSEPHHWFWAIKFSTLEQSIQLTYSARQPYFHTQNKHKQPWSNAGLCDFLKGDRKGQTEAKNTQIMQNHAPKNSLSKESLGQVSFQALNSSNASPTWAFWPGSSIKVGSSVENGPNSSHC